MTGSSLPNTGTRPKIQPTQAPSNQDDANTSQRIQNDSTNLPDLSTLLRDHERIKHSLSLLQSQLNHNQRLQPSPGTDSANNQRLQSSPGTYSANNQRLQSSPGTYSVSSRTNEEKRRTYSAEYLRAQEQRDLELRASPKVAGGEGVRLYQELERWKRQIDAENISAATNQVAAENISSATNQVASENISAATKQLSTTDGESEVDFLKSRLRELQDLILQIENSEKKRNIRSSRSEDRRENVSAQYRSLDYRNTDSAADYREQDYQVTNQGLDSRHVTNQGLQSRLVTNQGLESRFVNDQGLDTSRATNQGLDSRLGTNQGQEYPSTNQGKGSLNYDSDCDLVESNLALLTAQYEKNQEEEMSSYPPAMSIFNRWRRENPLHQVYGAYADSVSTVSQYDHQIGHTSAASHRESNQSSSAQQLGETLQGGGGAEYRNTSNSDQVALERELREKRDQLEHLIKKTVFSANINEAGRLENKDDVLTSFGEVMRSSNKKLNTRRQQHGILNQPNPPIRNSSSDAVRTSNSMGEYPEIEIIQRLQSQVGRLVSDLDSWSSRAPSAFTNSQDESNLQSRGEGCGRWAGDTDVPSSMLNSGVVRVPLDLQIQQLTLSMNQVYQVLWGLQREVSNVVERVGVLETRSMRRSSSEMSPPPPTTDVWNTGQDNLLWSGLNGETPSWSRVPDQTSQYPSRELWNSYQSPGLRNIPPVLETRNLTAPSSHGLGPISDHDSGVSSGALNNQVSPGMRANNYYDNFLSFSRQNRFSTPPVGAVLLPPVGGERGVDRPVAESLPANNTATVLNRTRKKYKINREQNRDQNPGCKRQLTNQALENRQLANQTLESRHLANQALENRHRANQALGNRYIPNEAVENRQFTNPLENNSIAPRTRNDTVNVYRSPTEPNRPDHSSLDNLTKNVYTQIQSIISGNDKAPEFLANLLDDLTLLAAQQNINISTLRVENHSSRRRQDLVGNPNLDRADTSSISSEEGIPRPPQRSSRSKVGTKRLPTQSPISLPIQFGDLDSSGGSQGPGFGLESSFSLPQGTGYAAVGGGGFPFTEDEVLGAEGFSNLNSAAGQANNFNILHESRRSSQHQLKPAINTSPHPPLGLILNPLSQTHPSSTAQSSAASAAGESTAITSSMAGQGGGSNSTWTSSSSQHSFAVPKNQQKNLMSRERDSRRMPGWQERGLPRNMQTAEPVPDPHGFINIQLQLPPENRDQQNQNFPAEEDETPAVVRLSVSDLTEAEMAEADQDRSATGEHSEHPPRPHHAFPNRDPDSPLRVAVNQVPMMLGLDRVPIRLQSTQGLDLEARRQIEDDSVASLVEEVLASSPELANPGQADLPPEL